VHYYWLVKADHRKPIVYGIVLGALLFYRVAIWASQKASERRKQRAIAVPSVDQAGATNP